ncbi:MAG: diguanylate cyclase [Candidatus Aminicenantes bacterium]|nr:diguanylate cyclase [Candidatus Aminicenantes bacterium]
MKILIVEDEAISRIVLARTLQKHKYEVLRATDGQKGWEIFKKEKDDIYIVILDWIMPKINGLQLCRMIKNETLSHYVYIIFLTSKRDIKDIVKGLEAGADDYLTKPFDRKELLARVNVGLRIIKLEGALKEANEKLHILAITDSLTEILNRRAVIDSLIKEISRSGRERKPLCIVMLDIDHFKAINDTYGHVAGDKVLKEVVSRAKTCLRPYDIIGRFGGEEFVLGIVNTDQEKSIEITERIRKNICEKPFKVEKKELRVSVSIGLTNITPPEIIDPNSVLDEMIKIADNALYEAKETGRNKVVYKELLI